METAANLLRVIHVTAGCVALLTFWVPLVVQKGNTIHRRVGWVYVGAMFAAAGTAVALAAIRLIQQPRDHWGPPLFLADVALLSFAAAFYGVRVLRQKKRTAAQPRGVDWVPPALLLISSVAMIAYGALAGFPLALYFAPVGLFVAVPQLRALGRAPAEKSWWLTGHLSMMLISCIATLTAFLVTNARMLFKAGDSPLVWLMPTFVGTALMVVWRRKYSARPAT